MAALLVDMDEEEAQMIDGKMGGRGRIVGFQCHIMGPVDAERARRIERTKVFPG
jgi:hypothetical protein